MNEKIYGCSSVQICQSSPNSQRNYQNGIKNWLFSPNLSLNPRPVSYRRYRRYRKKATLGEAIFSFFSQIQMHTLDTSVEEKIS